MLSKKGKILIGLVGLPGSGKTSTSKILQEKGFATIVLSSFIKKELVKKRLSPTRQNLQDTGDKMRQTRGLDILAAKALVKMKKHKNDKVVIDGIRNIAEVKRLKKEGFHLIGLSANPDVRFKRLLTKAGNKSNIKTWQDFIFYELRENVGTAKKHGQQNQFCYLQADYFIDNNSGIKALTKKVNQALNQIMAGKLKARV